MAPTSTTRPITASARSSSGLKNRVLERPASTIMLVRACDESARTRAPGASVARRGPGLALALALAVPGAEVWLTPLSPGVVVEEISLEADGRRLVADLYRPDAPRAGLLLVHGLSPAGRRHPELVRLARLLARQHQLVLVPHFDGLAAFQLSGREV